MEPGGAAAGDDLVARLRAAVSIGDDDATAAVTAQLSARAKAGDPAALLAYCHAMAATFASTPHAVPRFVAIGAPAAVVAALRGHVANAALQCAGLSALTWLATEGEGHAPHAAALAAAALAALDAHPADATVQGVACTGLARAAQALAQGGRVDDARTVLVRAPALAAAALRAHASDEPLLVDHACELLTTFAAVHSDDARRAAAAAAALAPAGAVPALVAVMARAPGAAATQAACCDVLCSLAVLAAPDPTIAAAALRAGAPAAAVAALRAAGTADAAAAVGACRLLGLLCGLEPESSSAAAAAGGVDAALAALAAHAAHAQVHKYGCVLLRSLSKQHGASQARAAVALRAWCRHSHAASTTLMSRRAACACCTL
jgi:hypothetical protein